MPIPEDTISVTNEVFTLVVQSATTTDAAERDRLLGQALVRSCDYLQRLQPRLLATDYDLVVTEGDRQALAQSSRPRSALELVAEDPDHFRGFLERETHLLIEAGMTPKIVDWLMSRVRARVTEYINDAAAGVELSQALEVLRDRVCRHRDVVLQRLRRQGGGNIVVLTLGGICLIVVDTAASSVLSPVGMAASCSIGGGLLKDAVKELLVGS